MLSATARFRAGRGRFLAASLGLSAVAAGGCKENLSAPQQGTDVDTLGPLVQLSPGSDTTVDSTGVLLVRVLVRDPSGVKDLDFVVAPATFGFPTQTPNDTSAVLIYPLQLGQFKHSTFRFYVRARDVLDYETVTDSVTVTVR